MDSLERKHLTAHGYTTLTMGLPVEAAADVVRRGLTDLTSFPTSPETAGRTLAQVPAA
jgi:hypothetical protein